MSDAAFKPANSGIVRMRVWLASNWSAYAIAIAALIAAYQLNKMPLNLGFGLQLLLSPILSYLILRAYGPLPGLIAATGGAWQTMHLWGHMWAAGAMMIEVCTLIGLWRVFRIRGLSAMLIFWAGIGAPYIYVTYGLILDFDNISLESVILKQAVNSLAGLTIGNILCFTLASVFKLSLPMMARHPFSAGGIVASIITLAALIPSLTHLSLSAQLNEEKFERDSREVLQQGYLRYRFLIQEKLLATYDPLSQSDRPAHVTYYLLNRSGTHLSLVDKSLGAPTTLYLEQAEVDRLKSGSLSTDVTNAYLLGKIDKYRIADLWRSGTVIPSDGQILIGAVAIKDFLHLLLMSYSDFETSLYPSLDARGASAMQQEAQRLCGMSTLDNHRITPHGLENSYRLEPNLGPLMPPMQRWLKSCYFGILKIGENLSFIFTTTRRDGILDVRIDSRNTLRLHFLIVILVLLLGVAISRMISGKASIYLERLRNAPDHVGPINSDFSIVREFRALQSGLSELMTVLAERRTAVANITGRMNSLMSTAPIAIYSATINADTTTITFCSTSLQTMLDIPISHFIDIQCWHGKIVKGDLDIRGRMIEDAALKGRGDADYRITSPTGKPLWIREHLRKDSENTSAHLATFTGCLMNITSQKEAELRLIQSSKMLTLGEMATGIAHELNQPLNIIALTADNADSDLDELRQEILNSADHDNPTQISALESLRLRLARITKQVERAGSLIHHMRIFGREPTLESQSFSLRSAVQDALSLLEQQLRSHNIVLKFNVGDFDPLTFGHPQLLEQVAVNLVMNARDAILENRQSRPEDYSLVDIDEIEISIKRADGPSPILMTVADTGGGIPLEHIDKLFRPFYTTKPPGKGTGLGLSICYGIISDMRGQISIRNGQGGAIVEVLLPEAKPGQQLARG